MERQQQPSSRVEEQAEQGPQFNVSNEARQTEGESPVPLADVMSVEAMDAHRDRQYDEYRRRLKGLPINTVDYRVAQARFDLYGVPEINHRYLQMHGIDESHPQYSDLYSMLDRYSMRSPLSWLPEGDYGWRFGPSGADGQPLPSGRDLYQQEWQARFGQNPQTPPHTAPEVSQVSSSPEASTRDLDELTRLQQQVEAARREADEIFAERMKAGPLEGKKRRRAIEEGFYEAHQELQRREAAFDDKFIALMRQGGATDEQIAEVVAHGAKERNDHYANSQQDAMIGTGVGGTVRRGLQRYERLGTPAKVAVGLGATALVGVMGVVTGGVMTMAGVAGMAAARGYRTYGLQRAKLYRDAGPTQEIAYKKQDGDVRAAQEILEESRAKERERAKVRIEEGDKIKKRALGLGAAALAVTGVGVAIEHQDELRRLGTNSRILWSYLFDRDVNIPEVGVDTEPDQVPDSDPDTGKVEAPDRTPIPVPTLPGGEYVTQGAYEIRTGEGWFRTFSEMGIDNADAQATLLEDRQLMNELRQLKLAYPDSSLGGWGIYQQPNGTMPPAAIDSILRAATRHGISAS